VGYLGLYVGCPEVPKEGEVLGNPWGGIKLGWKNWQDRTEKKSWWLLLEL